jgi:hypothetical protein
MFHNSTTIYRFEKNTAFTSGERRNVYGAVETTQKIAKGTLNVGKTITKGVWKLLNRNPLFRIAFAPFYWGAKGAKWSYDRVQDGIYYGELGLRTGGEALRGVGLATARPAITLALAPLRDIKMTNLWDLPVQVLKSAIKLPIAIAKSPLELVRGVRDSITSVPRNLVDIWRSVTHLEVRNSIKNVLKLGRDIVLPPLARPLKPILVEPAKVISVATRAKLQYALAFKKAGEQVMDGGRHIKGSYGIAKAKMAEVVAAREAQKKKWQEADEEQKSEEQGVKTGGKPGEKKEGGKKGSEKKEGGERHMRAAA